MDQFEQDPMEQPEFEQEGDEPQPEPKLVRIRLQGKTLMVTEDVADAIQAREDGFNRKLSEQGAELGRLRQQSRPETPQAQPEDPADQDLEFFQSPTRFLQRFAQQVEERTTQRLQQEQQAREGIRQWWDNFYRQNGDLDGHRRAVDFVMQEIYQEIAHLPLHESQQILADRTREFLGGKGQQEGRTLPNKQVTSERSSSQGQTRKQAPQSDNEPKTLGDALRSRAEQKRQALYHARKTSN